MSERLHPEAYEDASGGVLGTADKALGRRVAAALIDSVLLGIVFVAISILSGQSETAPGAFRVNLRGAPFLAWLLIIVGYFTILEGAWNGQTLGKRLFGVRVVSETGALGWGAVIGRNLLRLVDALPVLYLLGFVVAIANGNRKRVGDFATRTRVVLR